jgi:hypothetical protein
MRLKNYLWVVVCLSACGSQTSKSSPTTNTGTTQIQSQSDASIGASTIKTNVDNPYYSDDTSSILRIFADRSTQKIITTSVNHLISKCIATSGFVYDYTIPREDKKKKYLQLDSDLIITSYELAEKYGYSLPLDELQESRGMITVFREEVRREAAEREKKKILVKRAEDILKK